MNKLVFVSQKYPKTLRAEKNVGLFSGAKFFQKVFLKRKNLYGAANCSCELPHNNLNSKVTPESTELLLSLILFELHTVRIKYFSYSCTVFLGFRIVSISCHLTVKACQNISDNWLFA